MDKETAERIAKSLEEIEKLLGNISWNTSHMGEIKTYLEVICGILGEMSGKY